MSEGHLGCVCYANVTLVVAIGEDSLMVKAEIYYSLDIFYWKVCDKDNRENLYTVRESSDLKVFRK